MNAVVVLLLCTAKQIEEQRRFVPVRLGSVREDDKHNILIER